MYLHNIFHTAVAQYTYLSCDTFGSRKNISSAIICPNEDISCSCESDDTKAVYIVWFLPTDGCQTNYGSNTSYIRFIRNSAFCEDMVQNCSSNMSQVTARNLLVLNNICTMSSINIISSLSIINLQCALYLYGIGLTAYSNLKLHLPTGRFISAYMIQLSV